MLIKNELLSIDNTPIILRPDSPFLHSYLDDFYKSNKLIEIEVHDFQRQPLTLKEKTVALAKVAL